MTLYDIQHMNDTCMAAYMFIILLYSLASIRYNIVHSLRNTTTDSFDVLAFFITEFVYVFMGCSTSVT